MTNMRYFGNTHDPRAPHADRYVIHCGHEDRAQAIQRHKGWLSDKLIGRPQASDTYTTEQLEEMGMVGVYSYDIDDHARADPDECIVYYDGPFYSNLHAVERHEAIDRDFGMKRVKNKKCSDCNGKGIYEGFNLKAEPCIKCNGSGKE